jgi:hypothetical protein
MQYLVGIKLRARISNAKTSTLKKRRELMRNNGKHRRKLEN